MLSRRRILILVIATVLAAFVLRYYLIGHQTPAGQRPLVELNDRALEELREDFNRASEQVRIILLLSPT